MQVVIDIVVEEEEEEGEGEGLKNWNNFHCPCVNEDEEE
jgi:hypothetical protein